MSWLSCGCREPDASKANDHIAGEADSADRWWRNMCSPPVEPQRCRSISQDSLGGDSSSKTVYRHLAEFGEEPNLCVYSVCDFPGVGADGKASLSNGHTRKPRACQIPPNTKDGVPVKTDNFEGNTMLMIKRSPAHASSEDRYYSHFHKRRRLWEFRIQGKFKRVPEGEMFIGIVLRDFKYDQAVESSSVLVKKMAMMLVQYESYMHWGDRNEASRLPDAELSHMVTNLTGWDQIIVSPAGEEPPKIGGDLTGLGLLRKDEGLKEYSKACSQLLKDVDLESTYTFGFWGVSQLLDVLHWRFLFNQMGIGATIPMARFFEEWPIHCCMYELDSTNLTKDDKRHLESRKRYYVDMIVWSSTIPAVAENAKFMQTYRFMDAPSSVAELAEPGADAGSPNNRRGRLGGLLGRLAPARTNGNSTPNGSSVARRKNGKARIPTSEEDHSDDVFYSCSSDEGTPRGSAPQRTWFAPWRKTNGNSNHIDEDTAHKSLLQSRRARLIKS